VTPSGHIPNAIAVVKTSTLGVFDCLNVIDQSLEKKRGVSVMQLTQH
jgi:hypothetical protein